jgi:predicted Ser/Thr protein kinase
MDTLVVDLPSVEDSEYARHYGHKVGQGAFRAVFRIPGSRWAYKFERTDAECWFKDRTANLTEMRNYAEQKDNLPEGVAFPEMILLDNGAIAVKFVDGLTAVKSHCDRYDDCNCSSHGLTKCWLDLISGINIRDLHGRNVMISPKDKKVYIIDIGEFGERD